jgi:hypothetical protein
MKRERIKGISRNIVITGAVWVLVIGLLMVTTQSNYATETEEGRVNFASSSKMESPGIPPIDEATPPLIETATFGLG